MNVNTMLDNNSGKKIPLAKLVAFYHNIKPRLELNEIHNIICNIHDRKLNPRKLGNMQISKIN